MICFLPTAAEAGGCECKNRWNMLNLLELLCEIGRFAQLWFALIYFYSQTWRWLQLKTEKKTTISIISFVLFVHFCDWQRVLFSPFGKSDSLLNLTNIAQIRPRLGMMMVAPSANRSRTSLSVYTLWIRTDDSTRGSEPDQKIILVIEPILKSITIIINNHKAEEEYQQILISKMAKIIISQLLLVSL